MAASEASRLQEEALSALNGLLESSSADSINADQHQFDLFFCVLEHVFSHGLKQEKRNFWATTKVEPRDFYTFLENLGRINPAAKKFMDLVVNFPSARTSKGKGRLWFRLALKEKKLKDYLQILTGDQVLMDKWYEPWALLQDRDKREMLMGMLAPLSMLDVPISFKNTNFDTLSDDLQFFKGLPPAGTAPDESLGNGLATLQPLSPVRSPIVGLQVPLTPSAATTITPSSAPSTPQKARKTPEQQLLEVKMVEIEHLTRTLQEQFDVIEAKDKEIAALKAQQSLPANNAENTTPKEIPDTANSSIEVLQQDISELQAQLRDAQKHQQEAIAEKAVLQNQIDKLEKERGLESERGTSVDTNERIAELEKKLASSLSEKEGLEQEIRSVHENFAMERQKQGVELEIHTRSLQEKHTQEVEELSQEKDKIKAELAEVYEAKQEVVSRLEAIQRAQEVSEASAKDGLEATVAELQKTQSQNESLSLRVQELEATNKEKGEQFDTLRQQYNEEASKLQAQQLTIDQLQNEKGALEEDFKAVKQQNSAALEELQKESEEAIANLKRRGQEVEELKELIKQLENSKEKALAVASAEASGTEEQLQGELNSAKETLQAKEEEIRKINEATQEKDAQLQRLEKRISKIQKQAEHDLAGKDASIARLNEQMDEKQKKVDQLNQFLEEKEGNQDGMLNSLNEELRVKDEKVEKLSTDIQRLEKSVEEKEERVKRLREKKQTKLGKIRQQISDSEKASEQAAAEASNERQRVEAKFAEESRIAQAALAELKEELAHSNEKLVQQGKEIVEQQRQMQELTESKSRLVEQVNLNKSELEQAKSENAALKDNESEVKQQLEAMDAEKQQLIGKLKEEKEGRQKEVELWSAHMEQSKGNVEAATIEKEELKSSFVAQVQERDEKIAVLEEQIRQTAQQVEDKEEQEALHKAEREAAIAISKETEGQLQDEIVRLTKIVQESEGKQREQQELASKVEEEHREALATKTVDAEKLQARIDELIRENTDLQATAASANELGQTVRAEQERIRAQLAELQVEHDRKIAESEELKMDLDKTRRREKEAKDRAEAREVEQEVIHLKIKSRDDEIDRLKEELSQLQASAEAHVQDTLAKSAEKDSQIAELSAALGAEKAKLKEAEDQHGATIKQLEAEVAAQKQELSAITEKLKQQVDETENRDKIIAAKSAELLEAQTLTQRQGEILRGDIKKREEIIAGLRHDLQQKESELSDVSAQLQEKDREWREVSLDLTKCKEEITEHTKDIARLKGEARDMQAQISSLEEQTDRFQNMIQQKAETVREMEDALRAKEEELDDVNASLLVRNQEVEVVRNHMQEVAAQFAQKEAVWQGEINKGQVALQEGEEVLEQVKRSHMEEVRRLQQDSTVLRRQLESSEEQREALQISLQGTIRQLEQAGWRIPNRSVKKF